MSDVDISGLITSCKWVAKEAKKDSAKTLNKYLLQVIIGAKGVPGAIKRTPKADSAKIRAGFKTVTFIVLAMAKKANEKITLKEAKVRARNIINQRLRAKGYTAGPGWHKAAVGLGGRGVKTQGGFAKSKAGKGGRARKATESSLLAEIENAAPAATKIGTQALQAAVDAVIKDAIDYWEKKTQSTFDKIK